MKPEEQNINKLEKIKIILAQNYIEEVEPYNYKTKNSCKNSIEVENRLKNIKVPCFRVIS